MEGDNRPDNLRWADGKMQNDNKPNNKRVQGRRICQFDLEHNEIKRWNSIAELRRHYDIGDKKLKKWIREQIIIDGKYYFQYVDVVDGKIHPDEEWKENTSHPEIPKKIFVSNYGRIKEENGILHESRERGGYHRVSFSHGDGIGYEYSVHRLIAEAFCEKKENKNIVNHLDGNKTNNKKENLDYEDTRGNNIHSVQMGLRNYDKQCIAIERISKDGTITLFKSAAEAAKELRNTTNPKARAATLTRACKNDYNSYGYRWRYLEDTSVEDFPPVNPVTTKAVLVSNPVRPARKIKLEDFLKIVR